MDSWVTLKIFFISLKVVEQLRLTPFLSFFILIHDAPSDRGGGVKSWIVSMCGPVLG